MTLKRRQLFTVAAATVAWSAIQIGTAAAGGDHWYDDATAPGERSVRYTVGRAYYPFWIHTKPDPSTKGVRFVDAGELITIRAELDGAMIDSHNPIWYRTHDGYAHSSAVQPCENHWNLPATRITPGGQWAEVTVPRLIARDNPADDAPAAYSLYSGCMVRALERVNSPAGWPWYRIADDKRREPVYVWAQQLRLLRPEDTAPISPKVVDKRIEVSIPDQTVTAFENNTRVLRVRTATGIKMKRADGSVLDLTTDPGEHAVLFKLAGQHMIGGAAGDVNHFDLPGVSWTTYFTRGGISFHGTYWHNDYGLPRSHGCCNLQPAHAQWIYRWTTASGLASSSKIAGTRVTVIA